MAHEHRDLREVIDAFEELKKERVKGNVGDEFDIDYFVPDILDDYFEEQEKLLDLYGHIDMRKVIADFEELKNEEVYGSVSDLEQIGNFVSETLEDYFKMLKKMFGDSR